MFIGNIDRAKLNSVKVQFANLHQHRGISCLPTKPSTQNLLNLKIIHPIYQYLV